MPDPVHPASRLGDGGRVEDSFNSDALLTFNHDDQVDSTTQYLEWASNRTVDVVSASTGRRDTSNAGDLGLGDMSSGGGRGRFGGFL